MEAASLKELREKKKKKVFLTNRADRQEGVVNFFCQMACEIMHFTYSQ